MNALADSELDHAIADDVRMIAAALDDREKHLEAVAGCEKSAVLSAWRLGGRLIEKKRRLPRGGWLPWLATAGISTSSAADYMRLAREISDAGNLGASIRATLRVLPAPKPATPANRAAPQAPQNEAATTAQRDRVMALARGQAAARAEMAPDPFAALEKALDDERGKNEGLVEKLAIVEAQLDPKQLDQIEGLNAQISTLKSQVNSWQSKYADVKRERDSWKRKAKQLEKQLAA